MTSATAARVAAVQSQGTALRARAGENVRELNSGTGIDTRTEALDKGIAHQSAPVRRAGVSLRPSTAEVGGRAIIPGTNTMTGSNFDTGRAAGVSPRGARAAAITVSGLSVNPDSLAAWEATAAANETCRQQYTECMDQFCNVLDSNQKRCSCSSNLGKYTQVQTAVKSANDQLNDVAQRIRYVGLSADEIRAIMSSTEAEQALKGTRDTTESRKMLDQIEQLIKDPNAFAAQNSTNGIMDLDLDFSKNVDFADLFDLQFGSGSSFANLRGPQLFSAAKNKCAKVLDACRKSGADVSQVTSNYDLLIDKDCLAYEQGLTKMNDTLKTNVRAATVMLQKARLAVLQDQNIYDTRGCLNALEKCMTDDMVCGADYTKCLDPTKTFIDENGEVILGQNVAQILLMMTNYVNAMVPDLTRAMSIGAYVNCTVKPNNDGSCIVKYLLDKIGTGGTTTGLCRPVLDKCRRVSYTDRGRYDPTNEVIKDYIQRTMVNIRSAQYKIISDYAMGCMANLQTCYAQQVSQINAWSSNANLDTVYLVMKGACRNVALSCAYAVFQQDPTSCPFDPNNPMEPNNAIRCIEAISDIFYQSLLCPINAVYVSPTFPNTGQQPDASQKISNRCFCQKGFCVMSGQCIQPAAGTSCPN